MMHRERYILCKTCWKRQFSDLQLEGKLVPSEVQLDAGASDRCYICSGLMNSVDSLVNKALKAVQGYEFETFHVGARVKPEISEREDEFRSKFKLRGRASIKSALTKTVRRSIAEQLEKKVSFSKPDVVILLDLHKDEVKINSRSLFLEGRYIKSKKGFPQKAPRCSSCRGRGCSECNGTGMSREKSVELFLTKKLLEYFKGERVKITWLGGEGRESLVLGRGRPFYAEIFEPHTRQIKGVELLKKGHEEVELKSLRVIESIPRTLPPFIVKAEVDVEFERAVARETLEEIVERFGGTSVQVRSTKKMKASPKAIHKLEIKRFKPTNALLAIRCDGGLNIMKFISGEEDEVTPSLSKMLDAKARCTRFNVLGVSMKPRETHYSTIT